MGDGPLTEQELAERRKLQTTILADAERILASHEFKDDTRVLAERNAARARSELRYLDTCAALSASLLAAQEALRQIEREPEAWGGLLATICRMKDIARGALLGVSAGQNMLSPDAQIAAEEALDASIELLGPEATDG